MCDLVFFGCLLIDFQRVIYATGVDGILDFVSDLGIVSFALFGFLLEGEDEVGGVVGLFVDFACEEVVEVVQEWDVEKVPVRCGDRDVHRLDFEEGVGVGEELEHVFADGGADGGGPVVFVGAVRGDEEYEVNLIFAE